MCNLDLSERRVLVTGGSGEIGLSIVSALARHGAVVAMAARAGQKLKDARQALMREGRDVFAVVMDIESYESILEAVNLLKSRWGGLDVLINCAGMGMASFNPSFTVQARPFYAFSPDDMMRSMHINYLGVFAVCQCFIPIFIEQREGSIINVGADIEEMCMRGFAPWGPAKSALNTLTDIMSLELKSSGIDVNLLTPGGFVSGGLMPPDASEESFGRLLESSIMGEPAVYLSSHDARGITGEHVVASQFSTWLEREKESRRGRFGQ